METLTFRQPRIVALIILAFLVAISARVVEKLSGRDSETTIAVYLPLDAWLPLPDDVSEAEWQRAGGYPAHGRLERGWTIPNTPIYRFEGIDELGERFALLAGPRQMLVSPSPVWVGGLFLRVMKDKAGRSGAASRCSTA